MLEHLRVSRRLTGGQRKARLYLCACCRHAWENPSRRARTAVDAAEQFADGGTRTKELTAGRRAAEDEAYSLFGDDPWWRRLWKMVSAKDGFIAWPALAAAAAAAGWIEEEQFYRVALSLGVREVGRRCALIRCIFGNPFRPLPAADPAWLRWNGGAILKLARAVYEDRAFERLPILADALEEAGCADADLLGHLRGPGPHARGCWAVDWILGKG
jgi:hypothetical protein